MDHVDEIAPAARDASVEGQIRDLTTILSRLSARLTLLGGRLRHVEERIDALFPTGPRPADRLAPWVVGTAPETAEDPTTFVAAHHCDPRLLAAASRVGR
ncbi:hypothetical protein F0L68_05415 [Solihabitans fulvus]|uniref:Uncharacterized protein n=1 Tax=Solihabitans fulvus TaxID=1892852 RepID=A0A5B2XQ77_9PSEU|nr:hypothetical protein [Solihabitans fulvus]KAA2265100.1 hypothetical protein F0L68_05415 [Solihabitans fulvus]